MDRLNGLVLEAQRDIFRLARRDCGLDLTEISAKSNIPYPSIKAYAAGNHAMPLVAVLKLAGIIPDALLSRLFASVEKQLGDAQTELFAEASE